MRKLFIGVVVALSALMAVFVPHQVPAGTLDANLEPVRLIGPGISVQKETESEKFTDFDCFAMGSEMPMTRYGGFPFADIVTHTGPLPCTEGANITIYPLAILLNIVIVTGGVLLVALGFVRLADRKR